MKDDSILLDDELRSLQRGEPDPVKSARVRAMCHAQLLRDNPVAAADEGRMSPFRRRMEASFVTAFCVVYLSTLAFTAVHALGAR